MSILVIAEHDHNTIKPSTLVTVAAAQKLALPIILFVGGHQCQAAALQATCIDGVQKVIICDHPALQYFLAEPFCEALLQIAKNYQYIMTPATTFAKNILPRLAAQLDVGQLSDVMEILTKDTFARPIYAGNAIATVRSDDTIKLMTIRTTSFTQASIGLQQADISTLELPSTTQTRMQFVRLNETKSDRPDLTSAKIVVSGGRALQKKDNFKLIEQLADCLHAAIGASRAAVDAGYVPNDYQVGQTGKIVAPELYIAIGISGAIQHLAGMKDSKIIVAINKDADAPIFQIADYGLVGDLFQIVPELIAEIKKIPI